MVFCSIPSLLNEAFDKDAGYRCCCNVLCFEPLAHRIRLDPHIDGLRLPGSRDEARFSGYADDATTFVLNVISIYKVINLFSNFGMASGALLNRSKSQGLWIGTMPSDAKSCGLTWVSSIQISGVYFGPDSYMNNVNNIMNKLQKVVSLHKATALPIHAKVDLISIIFCSKRWYAGSCIMFDSDFESKVTKLLFGYIWKSTEWVSRTTIVRPRHEGGRFTGIFT